MNNKFKLSRSVASVANHFRLKPMTRAVLLATAGLATVGAVHANKDGFGQGSDGMPVQTFYANTYVANTGDMDKTGNAVRGLRKFIDTLPGVPGVHGGANNLGQYMPLGVSDKTSYTGSDYYEIAVVEYTEKMHTDLAKATTLRGYVQIDRRMTNTSAGSVANTAYAKYLTDQAAWTTANAAFQAYSTAKAAWDTANLAYQQYLIDLGVWAPYQAYVVENQAYLDFVAANAKYTSDLASYNSTCTILESAGLICSNYLTQPVAPTTVPQPAVVARPTGTAPALVAIPGTAPAVVADPGPAPTVVFATTGSGVPSTNSKGVALFNLDGTPIMVYKEVGNATGVMDATWDHSLAQPLTKVQAYGYDKPHYLGPVIVAQRANAVRIKYVNALPSGRAVDTKAADGTVISVARNGDLFLPVDETLIGSGYGPDGMTMYTQNRTALHWHGGDTPWISDGTPHQWIVPADDEAALSGIKVNGLDAHMGRGASQANVPDMPEPGPGAETLYFPNNLSGRLMFYHDHAVAITRLNVYAGIAAGYLIQDPTEVALQAAPTTTTTINGVTIPGANLPTDMIPLVIQDRTFVPHDVAQEDTYWDTKHWGAEGDLWFPHVYETNQNPASPDGTNPVGRWDYGPWFWPVFPAPLQLPTGAYGDVSTTPEGFMDTPIVNGTAYPTTTVEPKAYRLRILNAANDRMINLGFYVADDTVTTADGRKNTEVKMVPFSGPNSPTTTTYACPDGTTIGQRVGDVNANGTVKVAGWSESGPSSAPGNPTLYLNSFPCTGGLNGTGWGNQNNYPGGVPDPKMAGPDIIAIGTEGGILPNPVVIPSTPVNYEFNKRSVTVMNVMERGLYVGTAERADVIVDFSQYAGKTLILFNDSPAPLPAGDPRIDYYTDDGDQTGAGGAMNTVAGFGPNTRTVMQFVVSGTQNGTAFDIAPLQAALPAAYAASQEAPLIPEKAYNNAFLTNSGDNFATIYSGSSIQPNFVWTPTTTTAQTLQSIAVTGQGVGYTVAPTVVLSGAGLPTAGITINPVASSAGAQVAGGKVTSVIIPAGLAATLSITSSPTVTFVSNKDALGVKVGGGATAQGFTNMTSSLPVKNKAIQELFDPSYGRMNATLGVELPFTSPLNQTTIPLGYIDPATEMLNDGEVQIWKITHNGVDTHPVHFHLVNLQVLNRVGWDGTIKPPYDDEQGWKETIKMNPLEDIYVAVKPRAPMLPFGIKESMRLMDPSQPSGSITGFTQVDPFTGVAPIDPKTGLTTQISNKEASYGWEYVWHCHILGHEENDFMRPIVFNFGAQLPNAPTPLSTTSTFAANTASKVVLNWVDPTPVTATTTPGNKQNEIGFKISRATGNSTTFTPVGTALANVTTFTDAAPATATGYTYKVVAYNSIGDGPAASLTWPGSSSTPLNCSGTKGIKTTNNGTAPNVMVVAPAITDVSLVGTAPNVTFTDKSNNESGFYVYRALVGASTCAYQQVANPGTNSSNSVTVKDTLITGNNALVAGATYRYAVQSYRIVTGKNPVTYISAPATFDFVFPGSLDVNGLTATANSMTTVTLSWTDNSLAETGYTITRNGGATFTPVTLSGHLGTGTVTYVDSTAVANTAYTYTVTATGTPANGTTASVSVTTPFDPAMTLAAPSNVMVQMTGANTAQVSFNDLASKETIYLVQVSTDSGKSWGDGTINTFTLGAPNAYVATLTRSNGSALIAGTGGAVTIGVPSNRNAANLTFTSGATPYLFRVAPAIGSPVNGTFTDAVALTTTNYTGATITTMGAWGNLATIDLSGMTIIAPPRAVIATASAAPKYGTVALSWVDNANNNASYLLEKSVDSGVTWTGTGVAIGGADTSATVTGLAAVPTVFRLKAVSLGKNASSFVSSNSVTPVALPLPAAPAKPSVTSGNAGGTVTARVNWTAVADAATYTVQWSTSATFATGATIKSGSANQTGTSYTLSAPTGVTGGTLVYFRIVAVNATGSSAPSLISNAATAQ